MLTLEQIKNYQSEIQKIELSENDFKRVRKTAKTINYGFTFTELIKYILEHEKAVMNNNFQKALFIERLFEDINYHRELEYLKKCDYENVANIYLNY
ncbi:hypothetical protein [Capnocytophaga sp. oral taxon 338]|uniref:hypothetical protein n=1 Tax=Capnocytophaga sp. oral taxon 338 TaxID=710239 RepID=UPI000202D1BE|nr:hypothetical protein [Capnocytophaga sp. oral taxon 338]EGD33329.1 hypothetical protein HMPREF9071_2123 [Capnocytophaga sp. oral taxon 338 str. F0234]